MRKAGDRAGEARGKKKKKRQGQESVESTTECHCSKDGRILVRVYVETDRQDRRCVFMGLGRTLPSDL